MAVNYKKGCEEGNSEGNVRKRKGAGKIEFNRGK
jgi:hypothetical protein